MDIIDLHCDTISRLEGELLPAGMKAAGSTLRENTFHIDLQKLRAGGYLLQTFALFIDTMRHPDAFAWYERLLARFYAELAQNADRVGLVTSYAQIEENKRRGRISALLSVEEGAVCGADLSRIAKLYTQGVRMMTLVWNYENVIASPNRLPKIQWETTAEKTGRKRVGSTGAEKTTIRQEMAPETEKGLTAFGHEVVAEMNRLSMLIDVSHMGDAGIRDVLSVSSQPIVASHSNARACCGHVRNLPDELIRGIAKKGGLIGINFCPAFVENRPEPQCRSTIEGLLRHIRHLQNVGGMDCVAIGTDFDGMDGDLEIADASQMQRLVCGMEQAGFSQTAIEKLCYKNALRLLREMLRDTN